MHEKIVLITGATNGIGRLTAEGLAQLGAHAVIVGRSEERCRAVVDGIRACGGAADYLLADLSSLGQVRQLVSQVYATYERLDVLINNVGALYTRRQLSPDGLELTMALNYFCPFLLTLSLLELLKKTAARFGEARIVNVSSSSYACGRIDLSDLQSQKAYPWMGFPAYFSSKLADLLFTFELARRLAGTPVTANALHPGYVASRFGTNSIPFMEAALKLWGRIAWTPAEGARTSIYLASSPQVRGVSGGYFVKCRPVRAAPRAHDEQLQRRLWEVSQQITSAPRDTGVD